ncbi:hypothetical protein H7F37_12195 [Winogradskyella sp. PAMC22761]|nr:hypothetical protein H7F37_12195 [Winogradskyella sp. PAMC22761]
MKQLDILIEPSFQSTMEEMGIFSNEEYNSDAVLFEQGYNMFYIEIEPGEEFIIKAHTQGHVDCSEIAYKFIRKKEKWETDEDLRDDEYDADDCVMFSLSPGNYMFLEDGITIKELES